MDAYDNPAMAYSDTPTPKPESDPLYGLINNTIM